MPDILTYSRMRQSSTKLLLGRIAVTTYVDATCCYRRSSVVCLPHWWIVSPAKPAEPIEMPFGLKTPVGTGNIRWGSRFPTATFKPKIVSGHKKWAGGQACSDTHPASGSGERCKVPQRGLGRSPSRNRIWCILALKCGIWWQQF